MDVVLDVVVVARVFVDAPLNAALLITDARFRNLTDLIRPTGVQPGYIGNKTVLTHG
jgi:hypothetical protein